MNKKVIVLGAGISGLTIAYLFARPVRSRQPYKVDGRSLPINKNGYDVTVLEKKSVVGGSIETSLENGFLFDRGPNSGLETHPLIAELVEELGLKDEMVYAGKEAVKRYILRNNKLHPLPMNPVSLYKTKLFSAKAKLRLLREPFIGKSKDGYYQSVAQFVQRRLGKEFLDFAIDPFVAGVYAGRPEELSVKSAFPKLYELEEKYGGLIIGTIKSLKERKSRAEKSKQSAKMFSFKSGMQILPGTIAASLGERVQLETEVTSIEKFNSGYRIKFICGEERNSLDCDIVISTLPAYSAANLIKDLDIKTAEHLLNVFYPPVLVLYLGYEKTAIGRALDGFGFLIPSNEKKSFLGAIWSSVIFPNRCENDKAAFTLFIGGSRNPEISNTDRDGIIQKALNEFQELMKIKEEPVFQSSRFWSKAIPQYNVGYIEHEKAFEEFENKYPGIFLAGNYRGGISLGDCVKSSEAIYKKILGVSAS